ncbi:glycosyltransferase family 9 protein [Halomonas sp. ML-15]|uniref:glycosyltransferase family 9 protein n=1 Tax=Halomonas sp. ML-15 TaxID=2773305 RepID=UPI001747B249|nr:glycosyltransferase family 9 protein [Halomonas sp. ML-15]MBD3897058.1 glycosyltransferase family 9 protein [Halomonas sp. ML-15]
MTTSPSAPRRILVVRNDKLGDFMLAWPALACLKRADAGLHITALVPAYTAPLAEACPWIDAVILDPGDGAPRQAQRALLDQLRAARFDALLTLFSTPRIGWLGFRAGIPVRLAPATKWAQLFYNHRVSQRRSRSLKPEYSYNLELAEALLVKLGITPPQVAPPYWPLDAGLRDAERRRLAKTLDLDLARPWVFLHPGSGGSAVNLDSTQYAHLAAGIARHAQCSPHWLLTFGPGEQQTAEKLCEALGEHRLDAQLVPPRATLRDFAQGLAAADLLIAGSTGPLHVAGCLNMATAGFYPAKRSSTPLRWQTCNAAEQRLAFCPPPGKHSESDMSRIDLNDAALRISALLDRQAVRSGS